MWSNACILVKSICSSDDEKMSSVHTDRSDCREREREKKVNCLRDLSLAACGSQKGTVRFHHLSLAGSRKKRDDYALQFMNRQCTTERRPG